MIKKEIEHAINEQINAELFSSYLYYSMAAYFDSMSLSGFSHWMRAQALEEMSHVDKFFTYLGNRGGKVILTSIAAPVTEWKSPKEVFDQVYEHEVYVTSLVNKLMDLSLSLSDHATANFLQWFIAEQVEEETTADNVVQQLKLIEKTEGGLFLLDQELAKRALSLTSMINGG